MPLLNDEIIARVAKQVLLYLDPLIEVFSNSSKKKKKNLLANVEIFT